MSKYIVLEYDPSRGGWAEENGTVWKIHLAAHEAAAQPSPQAMTAPATGSTGARATEKPETGSLAVRREESESEALTMRIRDAMELSYKCKIVYIEKGYEKQENFARGQLDAFQAVLNWINEAPPTLASATASERLPSNHD